MASARNSEVRFAPNVIGPVGAIGATIALILLGVPWPVALVVGLVVLGIAMGARSLIGGPKPRGIIDPFTVGEPWRQFVQGAQRARKRLHGTVAAADDGPLKDRMTRIIDRLDDGLEETWSIARRGDQIDDAVRRLDPAALRSKLEALEARRSTAPSPDTESAIASVQSQLATTDRMRAESTRAADRLRLTQTRLDELVARASEVAIGATDTERYEHDVDDLVIELEALRQAVEETNRP